MPLRRRAPIAAVTDPRTAALVRLARAYGAGDDVAVVEAARTADAGAARRALLYRLRSDRHLTPPPLGDPARLAAPPGADDAPAHPLARLDDEERAVLAGVWFDGLDAHALAGALGTNRTAVKAIARRGLAKLAGSEAGEQRLDTVATLMAGEYALGLLPPPAQELFERGLALDPTLAADVAAWDARFAAAFDRQEPVVAAPTGPGRPARISAAARVRPPWRWLSLTGLGVAALAALAAWSAASPHRSLPPARIAPAAPAVVGTARLLPLPPPAVEVPAVRR